jgi:hypothetical protein
MYQKLLVQNRKSKNGYAVAGSLNIYMDYYPRITFKTYLPAKRIGNKFLKCPGDNNGYYGLKFQMIVHTVCNIPVAISSIISRHMKTEPSLKGMVVPTFSAVVLS